MIINLLSDIHSEFWEDKKAYRSPGEGDVLILAGDIGLADDLKHGRGYFQQFLDECSQNYTKVFYVLGNHECYHGDFLTTESIIREHLPANITLLQNQSEHYEGIHFVGATLWTDFNNANANTMADMEKTMSEYNCAWHGDRFLSPVDTLHEHDSTIQWFNQVLPTLRGKKVVITHHLPSMKSLAGRYIHTPFGYATNLTQMIETYQPELWVHGHCHQTADYKIGNTRIVSNPYGYHGYELNKNFINPCTLTV